jgi:hypothetical protein
MLVDRVRCRLDSFTFREGNTSIDTLPVYSFWHFTFVLFSIESKQSAEQKKLVQKPSMYSY